MPHSASETSDFLCEACGHATRKSGVTVTLWFGAELKLVEGVPAQVCPNCHARYYDVAVEGKLDSLVAAGFPDQKVVRVMPTPVFSYSEIVDFARGEMCSPSGARPPAEAAPAAQAIHPRQSDRSSPETLTEVRS